MGQGAPGSDTEAESRFRLAMTHAAIGMCIVAPDGTFLEVNPALCLMLGRPPDELTACTWQELTHPDDLDTDSALVQEVLDGQRDSYRLLKRFLRPDGSAIWGDLTVACVRGDVGQVRYFVSQIADVTDLEQSHRALAQSEARYRLLAEHGTDVVIEGTNDGIITWLSESITGMLGWPPEHWVGHPLVELVHPDDLPSVREVQGALTRGRPGSYEARMRTADGRFRWVRAHARPVRDQHGTVIGRVGSWRDAEAEHQARELLAASERRFRLMAENASDVVYEVQPDRRVSWISPNVVDALGWSAEEIVGTRIYDLAHPDDRVAVDPYREAAFAGQRLDELPASLTMRFRRKAGGWVWMSVRTIPLWDDTGSFASAVNSLRNVDELVRARQRAEQAHDRLQSLLDSMLEPFVLLAAVRDVDGRVTDFTFADANPSALAVYGMVREDLIGASLTALHPSAVTSGLFARYVDVVDAGTPLILDDWPYRQDLFGGRMLRYDLRAVRVGDAVSQTWWDVTQRYEDMQRIRDSEERYRLLAENSSDVVLLARDGVMQWLSPSLSRMLGWQPRDWIGRRLEEFGHPSDMPMIGRRLAEVAAGETSIIRMRLRDSADGFHWVEMHASAFAREEAAADGSTGRHLLASFRTVDEAIAYERELKRRARLDDLTGALNRGELLRILGQFADDRRQPGADSAVLFCDLDDFKEVNDQLGHAAGDAVLRATAERMRSVVREGDLLARMGGDEFLVYLSGMHGLAESLAIAEKIRSAVAQPIIGGGLPAITVTMSVGVTLRHAGDSPDALIARADQAMYEAKRSGRNRVVSLPDGTAATGTDGPI